MNLIPKTGIDWEARQVRIRQGKTGNYKVIGPLGPTSMEILREFYDASKTDLVFSRSGNIAPKFYRILREACERAGVPYGRGTRDGLVLHDARHTATTHLLESNVSPKTVQEWMGWSDKAFVLYYSHATKRSREQAGRSLRQWPDKRLPERCASSSSTGSTVSQRASQTLPLRALLCASRSKRYLSIYVLCQTCCPQESHETGTTDDITIKWLRAFGLCPDNA